MVYTTTVWLLPINVWFAVWLQKWCFHWLLYGSAKQHYCSTSIVRTKVYVCFLDASRAFDRVSHNTRFNYLEKRDVPPISLRFLWSWYKDQSYTVKWNSYVSDPFGVTNGVCQGGVLSPVLFTVYLDELLQYLLTLNIDCHVGHHYVGSLCYADDTALLAASPSAPRILLRECELFATDHNFIFNAAKTQLICFRSSPKIKCTGKFFFSGHLLWHCYPPWSCFTLFTWWQWMTSREPHLKCVKKPLFFVWSTSQDGPL